MDAEASAIEWIAGREMDRSSMLVAATLEESRLARPLRMQTIPCRDIIIDGKGAIVRI